MREATEGKSFDAILEDEYRGIVDPIGRRLYLFVCCFYQHGSYLRDTLLAHLLGVPLTKLDGTTADATEGVVMYDCIDDSVGLYGARARHRTIATVVWERCGERSEREQLIAAALSGLNLKYRADKLAFENFYRSDRLVDSISTLDGKIKFFEVACTKEPVNPYIRQHYARMLARDGRFELALSQITEAIGLDPKVRILYHTKAVILKELALSIDSRDMARKRLAQSEENFQRALSMYSRDEYSYQGLAQLYLGWARRCEDPDEAADYIAKAEGSISEGLKKVKEHDSLWVESANIQQYLGDNPAKIKALERAVQTSPGSIVARYLLGRAYRKNGVYQKALDVLEPTIRNHHDEYRSFVEYAICLVHVNRSYKEAIAVLRLSTLYGYSDPRFIATFGGMLFMNGDLTGAQQVFDESTKHDFTVTELNAIQFRPPNSSGTSEPLCMDGEVVALKPGYAMIAVAGFRPFLCPGSKHGGIIMRVGLSIRFEPAFTARGAIADRPRPL